MCGPPRRAPAMNTEWFRARMADKKLSQRQLAKMLAIDPAAASLMFRGQRKMTQEEAAKLSVILGVNVTEIMRQAGINVVEDIRPARIAAYVDEDGLVTLLPNGTHESVAGPADCPVGTYAVQVRSHASIKDGWLLFVAPAQVPASQIMDQLCLVATANGKQLLGNVRRGYRQNTYNLVVWPNDELVEDAQIVWASTVLWIKPLY